MAHLEASSAETRMAVAWALGRFGNFAMSAAPKLAALTNDCAHNVREQAKVALARITSGGRTSAGLDTISQFSAASRLNDR